ncbi:hypothetical protein J4Q44_G00188500 [Coregonus suidteri]|uniref:Uncharacterized protein n=1 Tax=Coregonus suidteri TaxID=861788 RepID=A0AAN8LRD0_9TELE
MFYFLRMKDSSYRMKCLLCLPKVQEILAFKNLPSNIKKHIERKHVCHLKKYGELTANTLKRKHAPKTPSTIKQSTLLKTVSQKSMDKAVVKYVVQGLQPFAVVEQGLFREFVQDLQPNSKVLSRPTLRSRIGEATEMKKKVTEAMRGVDHIATTAGLQEDRASLVLQPTRYTLTVSSDALQPWPVNG